MFGWFGLIQFPYGFDSVLSTFIESIEWNIETGCYTYTSIAFSYFRLAIVMKQRFGVDFTGTILDLFVSGVTGVSNLFFSVRIPSLLHILCISCGSQYCLMLPIAEQHIACELGSAGVPIQLTSNFLKLNHLFSATIVDFRHYTLSDGVANMLTGMPVS